MAELPRAGEEEVDAAVARARKAFGDWRAVAPADRAALLHRLADALEERAGDLARLQARNVGKPIADARGEIAMVVHTLLFLSVQRDVATADPVGYATWAHQLAFHPSEGCR